MQEIISPIVMNGIARTFSFDDVKGYTKRVKLATVDNLTYVTVTYSCDKLSYIFYLYHDRVVFRKASAFDDSVTYEEFEKFCKIN